MHVKDLKDPVEVGLPPDNPSLVIACSKISSDFVPLGQFVDLPPYLLNGPAIESMVGRGLEVCILLDELAPPIDLLRRALFR